MPEQYYYKEALKAGQKEKKRLISMGKNPYLLVLDEIIEKEGFISEKRKKRPSCRACGLPALQCGGRNGVWKTMA